ncbi:PspA/IM30 family protein [Paenibacillus thailandensis]|uniref:PspA/IM30 family protein n=1 Tax=Paenibacillus thailandensis TaxID=393250 RepID=A0ABW5QXT5_9BACL
MGIFSRVKQIAAADIHGLLDRFEDPINMLKQYIRELEEQIDKAHDALAGLLASEKHYRILIANTQDIVVRRTRQAELAVDRKEDAIAELAIQEKLQHSKLLAGYEEQLAATRDRMAVLREELDRMAALHQELTMKLDALMIRARTAQVIEAAASATGCFRTDEIQRNVSRIEAKVWRMEAGADASRFVSSSFDSLKRIEQSDEVRAELESLKAARGR